LATVLVAMTVACTAQLLVSPLSTQRPKFRVLLDPQHESTNSLDEEASPFSSRREPPTVADLTLRFFFSFHNIAAPPFFFFFSMSVFRRFGMSSFQIPHEKFHRTEAQYRGVFVVRHFVLSEEQP
jgi:hypothetical protein